jgi:hypothetical protein
MCGLHLPKLLFLFARYPHRIQSSDAEDTRTPLPQSIRCCEPLSFPQDETMLLLCRMKPMTRPTHLMEGYSHSSLPRNAYL